MFHHVPCLAVRRFFSGDEGLSDLHDLLLLGFEQGIKFISGLLGDLVELLEQTIALVLTHLAVLDGLVKGFLGLASDVAHCDLAIFRLALAS